jgi:hypothetical protein
LRHGFPLGEHTFFKEVKVLPGGHFLRFRRGRLQIQRYFKMRFTEKAELDERKIQEQFVETWQDVMRRQTSGDLRMGSLLSGGLDSRLILAGLVAQGKQAPTFTMGHPGSPESSLAKQVAEAAECPNLFSPIIPNEVAASLERAVYLTDGMFNCFHANVQHLLPSLSVNFVFDGICPFDSFYNAGEVHLRKLFGCAEPARWLHQVVSDVNLPAFRLGPQQRITCSATSSAAFLKILSGVILSVTSCGRRRNNRKQRPRCSIFSASSSANNACLASGRFCCERWRRCGARISIKKYWI